MVKMGSTRRRARSLAAKFDEDGLSMVDAAYYGHKIKVYNEAKRAAQESRASTSATGWQRGPRKAGAPTQAAVDNLVERSTLTDHAR